MNAVPLSSVRKNSGASSGGVGGGDGHRSHRSAVLDAVEGYHGPVGPQVLRTQHVARVAVQGTVDEEGKGRFCFKGSCVAGMVQCSLTCRVLGPREAR